MRGILRVAVHRASPDRAGSRDHAVALRGAGVRADAASDRHERPGVAEELEALARRGCRLARGLGGCGNRGHAEMHRTALCPPNPNEFETAMWRELPLPEAVSSGRASFGT